MSSQTPESTSSPQLTSPDAWQSLRSKWLKATYWPIYFNLFGFIFSSALLWVSFSMALSAYYAPTFLSTHVVHGEFKNPLDHAYVAFDANLHAFQHYDNKDKETNAMKLLYNVDNKCLEDENAEFCGMLPWQLGNSVCLSASETVFEDALKKAGYDALDTTDKAIVKDLFEARGLIATSSNTDSTELVKTHYKQKSEQICQYESYNGAKLVLNEDSAYSLNSAHSVWVLWTTVWSIAFLSFGMTLKNKYAQMYNKTETQYIIDFALLFVVLLVYLLEFVLYGTNMPDDKALLRPNGSFVYSFVAIIYSWLFLRHSTSCDAADESVQDVALDGMTARLGFATPMKPTANSKPDMPRLQLDMTNFSKKTKTDAYMQAGKNGRNVLSAPLSHGVEISLNDYTKAAKKMHCSHFQLTQLWIVPLLLLVIFIYDKNFAIDIHVTVVFVLAMLFCILDVFSKKMIQLYDMLEELQDGNFHVGFALDLVQVVFLLIQASIVWHIYNFLQMHDHEQTQFNKSVVLPWNEIIFLYFGTALIFKLGRILSALFQHRIAWLRFVLKQHVYENASLFLLLIFLVVSFFDIYNNVGKLYGTIDCADMPESCKLLVKWGKNYDFNTLTAKNAVSYTF